MESTIKNKITILILFICIESVFIYFLLNNTKERKEQIIQSANKLVETNFYNTYNSFEKLANSVYKGYINKPEIQRLFANKDRDGLYHYLKGDYQYLESIDFKQIHFHTTTNHSFLRMHEPYKFGDDLTHIRYSVDYVNKNLKPITGLEMGKVVPGFRYVYPMFYNNKHIGSVETSFSVNSFINELEKVYDVHSHFLLKKEVFNKKIFDQFRKYYTTSIESTQYITLSQEHDNTTTQTDDLLHKTFKNSLRHTLVEGFTTLKIFGFDLQINEQENKIVTFLPLYNIQKEHIGYFVVYQNGSEITQLKKDFIKLLGLVTLINLLLSYIFYREFSQKMTLKEEVNNKTQELQEINKNLEQRIKKEVEKTRYQEQQLFEIEKLAQMGEMIGNIAHHWRQPLSAISTAASGIQVQHELGILEGETLKNHMEGIVRNTLQLSKTIDTFRDFIKNDTENKEVLLKDVLKTVHAIIEASLKNNQIELYDEIDYNSIQEVKTKQRLAQVMINILNNAKEILVHRQINHPWIKLKLHHIENGIVLLIEDNAGGISNEMLPKLFEPYSTTKHQSQGTGLGLHLSYNIVQTLLLGKLYAKNGDYGAIFYIEIYHN